MKVRSVVNGSVIDLPEDSTLIPSIYEPVDAPKKAKPSTKVEPLTTKVVVPLVKIKKVK